MKTNFTKYEVFSKIPPREAAALDRYFLKRTYLKGEYIFHEGDTVSHIHLITKGKIKRVIPTLQGRDVILSIAIQGEILDFESLFGNGMHNSSSVAVEDTEILILNKGRFKQLIESHADMMSYVVTTMSDRMKLHSQQIVELSAAKVDSRIASVILRLGEKIGVYNKDSSDEVKIDIHLSRQEIADLSGTTVESAIRVMRRFFKSQLVLTTRDSILIQNPQELQNIAQMY